MANASADVLMNETKQELVNRILNLRMRLAAAERFQEKWAPLAHALRSLIQDEVHDV